jgi:hypothetical protein
MQLIKVESKSDLLKFIKLPFTLYKKNNNWVAPVISEQMKFFDPAKNPYFDHSEVQLFLVVEKNQVLGRISAHTNKNHNLFHQDNKGFFGFFESINDTAVSNLLFTGVVEWLKERGCTSVIGPFNLSTNHDCGLLIEGFDHDPYIMMPYNFQYYHTLIDDCNFKKAMDMYSWKLNTTAVPPFLESLAKKIELRGNFTVRSLDKKNLKKDIEEVFTIYQQAWEKNWGFVPMTRKEFDHTVKTLMLYVNPELVFIAEYDGKPAGFSVSLPNYNVVLKKMKGKLNIFTICKFLYYKNKIKSSRCITMGVIPEFHGKGIDTLLYYYSLKNGMKHGIAEGELSWVLETNTMMNKIISRLYSQINKIYRIFEKDII